MSPEQVVDGARGPIGVPLFDVIDGRYANAGSCRVKKIIIAHPLFADIASYCARIFSMVDREDDHQRQLARSVWLLKSTIAQTLLPFDDSRLGVQPLIEKLVQQAETVPSVSETVEALSQAVASLVSSGSNPKREMFLHMLQKATLQADCAGVFAGLQGGLTPGWPATVDASQDFHAGACAVLRTRKDIADRGFSVIFIPGTLRFASRQIAIDLLYSGLARDLVLLAYRNENVFAPKPLGLPIDGKFKRATRTLEAVEEIEDQPLDQWANETFWHEIRSQHARGGALSGRDVTVSARFVLFADGSGTFLPDEGSVVEISRLLDRPDQPLAGAGQLPRKSVRDLEERDLVMMRLRGSGDYLDEVADRMMEREGQASLRDTATAWKSDLFRALKLHGEGVVARLAREAGLKLRSATYLWTWASDVVIAPHDFEDFRALMRVLGDFQDGMRSNSSEEYALHKWAEMERLRNFHLRAASEIRKALLERVLKLVEERSRVDVVESIQLPGLEAGSIGLLRVSAVDVSSVRVPFSRLFHLFPVKVS
jgi:acetolactate synthase regulatory subunit